MHPLIDKILEASRARPIGQSNWEIKDRRDLRASANCLKSKGIIPIIAEIKPLVLGRPLSPEEVIEYAKTYEAYDACAISVLTQPTHFLGSIENLKITREVSKLPVLRKDFIFDEIQIAEIQSDLVLLIASLNIDIEMFVEKAYSLGMEPLVEVHSQNELDQALKTDANIVGINNRDFGTLEVDLKTFERLAPKAKETGVFLVAESGVHNRADVLRMQDAGADAILVGTTLMEKPDRLVHLNTARLSSVFASSPSASPPYIL
ncbi:MAG: indole-3-glycerol-phosphate synthase [Methanotrichaceae archaeon]|nr:indole-3-glycerol-phosphate synthase [Methanotrichaceae archaeon]